MVSNSKPEYNRLYYLANKEKIKETNRKWQLLNRDKIIGYRRKSKLKKRYGMNSEDYDFLYEKQKGYCAICQCHQSELKRTLCIDHDHATGKVRGLLCNDCNKALGFFDDDVELLDKASLYLRKLDAQDYVPQ